MENATNGSPPKIKKLWGSVSNAVRAASVLPSLSRVIEELVLNSLDAGSNNIEVKVNPGTFSLEVNDDGIGICFSDLRDKTGEWNATSKFENGISHGFRGEALAATRVLSSMTVISKTAESGSTYKKSFDQQGNQEFDKRTFGLSRSSIIGCGTRVAAQQLFHRLPARRKSMRSSIELLRVKEFVQRMSILYHDVGWVLIDDSIGRVLMKLKPQVSVSARFAAFHGQQIQSKMKDISITHGQFSLCGLISQPHPDCCHWTREYQYFFVNNRWMRGTEIVANMVDKVFLATLTTQRSGGPASKHHAPNGNQLPPHPCFVLQLTCPPEAFDVLQEPDKSKAVFTDPYGLQLCVMDLLLKLFEVYRPDLLPSVRQVCSEHRNPHWANRGRSGNNDSRNTEIDNYRGADVCSVSAPLTDSNQFYAVRTKDHMRTTLTDQKPNSDQYYPIDLRNFRQPQSDSPDPTVFKKAFLETPPVERHTTEYDTSQPVSLFAEFEFITASNTSDSISVVDQRAGYTDSVDDSQYPAHVDTVTRETETDVYELSDDEITLRSNEETSIKGMGVTVSRLPGLIEYIDDQLNNFGSQLSAGTDQRERALSPDSESCYALHFQQSTEADEEDALSAADEMQGGNNIRSYTPISAERSPRSYESPQWQPIQDIKSKADCEDDYYHKEDRADEFPDMLSVEYFDRSTKVRRAIDSAAGAVNLPTSSTCRVDLNNTVFADAFFKASPDGKSLVTSAPANQGSGLSFPIGTQRFKNKKISSLKDKQSPSYSGDDFASYNGAIKKPKVVVRPPTTMTTAMTLRKEMLTNLRTIGQVDSKYLLAVSGKLILIVDQHAADERVKLEQFLQGGSSSDDRGGLEAATSQKLSSSVRERSLSGTQAVSEQISLTESDMYTLITRRKVFSEWKFIFDQVTIPDSDSITSKVLADCPRLRSADDMRTVRLTQVPLVYGEALTGHDFVEFIQSLSGHDSLIAPLSLLQPPSLRRIAASKACRTAIRFGDKLSLFECSDIMKKLSRTELPFQCAHGRPSVVPLLILDRDVSPTGCGGRLTELPNGKAVKLPSYSNFLKRKLM